MATYGYARVSTTDQDLAIQEQALTAAGCTIIRAEKVSGTKRQGRAELALLMEFLREGDTLVVTRIDRLARSVKDLQDIVWELKAKGVNLRATEQPIDTSTAAGKAFFGMLGVFAEFETNLRQERQLEGVAAAKAKGVYKGRVKSIDDERIREMIQTGAKPSHVARDLGISRASVYRAMGKAA
jgi:DNA invertase Pin-like site-specific DNA recombinase